MGKAAALIEGFVNAANVRHEWDDRKQRRKDDEEDRIWTREERQRRVEDREYDRKTREEDRAERRRIQRENEAWARKQRARQETAWGREDAEYAEAEGDKKVYADAYTHAQDARANDERKADLSTARAASRLGILPPENAADTYVIPGSSLERAANDAMVPPRPSAPPLAGAQPRITTEDTVIPPYEGSHPTPAAEMPPSGPARAAAPPAPPAPARGRGFLSVINPFGAADAAVPVPTAPPPGPPGPQAVEPAQLGIHDVLMRAPAPNPPAVAGTAPAAPAEAAILPIPAPRRVAPPPAVDAATPALPEASASGMAPPPAAAPAAVGGGTASSAPPAAASAPQPMPPGPGPAIMPVAPRGRSPATAAQPMPEPGVPMAMQAADSDKRGIGNIGAMRAGVDPRSLPPSGPGRSPSGPATPSQEIAQATLLGPRNPDYRAPTAKSGPGLGREPAGDAEAHVGDFMSYYQKEAVPQIVEHYLKTGRPEAAQTFQSWAQDQATKAGMAAWARGVRAAAAGDESGFLDNMIEAYNSEGYFDDGYDIDRKRSKFTRDADGTVTGAVLAFRDQATGKTFERTFDDISDIYELGTDFLSPEKVFEYGMGQIEAAAKAQQDELTQQRKIELEVFKAQARAQQTPQARIEEAFKTLSESDLTFAQLPPAEKAAKALEFIQSQDAAAAALAGNPARAAARTGVPMWTGDE